MSPVSSPFKQLCVSVSSFVCACGGRHWHWVSFLITGAPMNVSVITGSDQVTTVWSWQLSPLLRPSKEWPRFKWEHGNFLHMKRKCLPLTFPTKPFMVEARLTLQKGPWCCFHLLHFGHSETLSVAWERQGSLSLGCCISSECFPIFLPVFLLVTTSLVNPFPDLSLSSFKYLKEEIH